MVRGSVGVGAERDTVHDGEDDACGCDWRGRAVGGCAGRGERSRGRAHGDDRGVDRVV